MQDKDLYPKRIQVTHKCRQSLHFKKIFFVYKIGAFVYKI